MVPLPVRRFGRTELPMPLLSLGGMRFQQSWNDLPPDQISAESQANLRATLEAAVVAVRYAAAVGVLMYVVAAVARGRYVVPALVCVRYVDAALVCDRYVDVALAWVR